MIPTEEWVEKDVLKASTGKVEVHKECLVRFNPVQRLSRLPHPLLMTRTDAGGHSPGRDESVLLSDFPHCSPI